jgi:hypothetical protein
MGGDGQGVLLIRHGLRIVGLMLLAAVVLGWLAARTEVLFIDGLRYIAQAQRLSAGLWDEAIWKSIDHPVYPGIIALMHALRGGTTPESWQAAGQMAAIACGILLVIPAYLLGLELFGGRAAWIGTALIYALPNSAQVMADTLSESTFLLFWTWGIWGAVKFLRAGHFIWLPLIVAGGGMAFLVRPEGALLPAAMAVTLLAMPLMRSTRLNWPRWWAAVGVLIVGPMLVMVPLMLTKGSIGTKPAIAKILGLAPPAAADAVERARPLEPGQSELKTYQLAARATLDAVGDAVSWPLLPMGLLGLCLSFWQGEGVARIRVLISLILGVMWFALFRLHATGGYCTARHALALVVLWVPAAVRGIEWSLQRLSISGPTLGLGEGRYTPGPVVWVAFLSLYLVWLLPQTFNPPLGFDHVGYREAGRWLDRTIPRDERVVDVTGLALFYGARPGYTFRNLHEAFQTEKPPRWVVARINHLIGPWGYCETLRTLVDGHKPVAMYPRKPRPGQSRVLVFDLMQPAEELAKDGGPGRG